MKKLFIITMILGFSLSPRLFADEYAILISAGKATTDDVFSNSEYWYDLFLAYEDLILNEGYTHDNIIVFYGDGEDYYSNRPRYRTSLHGWGKITDFDNDYQTMKTQFGKIGQKITSNDNVHIRWVVGHGSTNTADNYSVEIENRYQAVSDRHLYPMINQIDKYARRTIVWMTCHSGCIVHGNKNLKNDQTVVISSSEWDDYSYSLQLPEETIHAELNYTVTSSLYGEDPTGKKYDADYNNDNEISFHELFHDADISDSVRSNPQLGDDGLIAPSTFIKGKLNLRDVKNSGPQKYESKHITASDYSVEKDGKVTFAAQDGIQLQSGFKVSAGASFNAYIGKIASNSFSVSSPVVMKSNEPDIFKATGPNYEIRTIEFKGETIRNKDIKIYPNPTNGIISVSANNHSDVYTINVYNKTSTLMLSHKTSDTDFEIDLSEFPGGVYYAKVIVNGVSTCEKIIKY